MWQTFWTLLGDHKWHLTELQSYQRSPRIMLEIDSCWKVSVEKASQVLYLWEAWTFYPEQEQLLPEKVKPLYLKRPRGPLSSDPFKHSQIPWRWGGSVRFDKERRQIVKEEQSYHRRTSQKDAIETQETMGKALQDPCSSLASSIHLPKVRFDHTVQPWICYHQLILLRICWRTLSSDIDIRQFNSNKDNLLNQGFHDLHIG